MFLQGVWVSSSDLLEDVVMLLHSDVLDSVSVSSGSKSDDESSINELITCSAEYRCWIEDVIFAVIFFFFFIVTLV